MKLSEVINAIGDDNILIQSLDQCIHAVKTIKAGARVEFDTQIPFSINGMERQGIVVWLDRQQSAAALALKPEPLQISYTNYKGETSERTITPIRPWFGSTEHHPEPQWLLQAFDHDKNAERDFAIKDFGENVWEIEHQLTSAEARIERAYTERTYTAVALAKMALLAGLKAGVGQDNNEQSDPEWRVVLYVETPAGQVSWHIAPRDQWVLEGLPKYEGVWDGTFRSRDGSFAIEAFKS